MLTPTAAPTPDSHFKTGAVPLGRTRFGEIDLGPTSLAVSLGGRRVSYQEEYYLGNPGLYQTYWLGINDAGRMDNGLDWTGLHDELGPDKHVVVADSDKPTLGQPATLAFRAMATVNTYAVTAAHLGGSLFPLAGLGPDLDQVRVLPGQSQRCRLKNR